jgi:hypothetical protein
LVEHLENSQFYWIQNQRSTVVGLQKSHSLRKGIETFTQLAVSQIQTAKVTGGEVQGVVNEGISIFKGIPFAAPPVGDMRWKAPAPVQAWTDVKKADAFVALRSSLEIVTQNGPFLLAACNCS